MNYRNNLIEERNWLLYHKEKLIEKASGKSTATSFKQIMKVISKYVKELDKINKILKDGRNW